MTTTKQRTPANILQLKAGNFYVINGQVLRYSKTDFMNRLNFTHLTDDTMEVVKFNKNQAVEIYNF